MRLVNKKLQCRNFPHDLLDNSNITYADNCYRFLQKRNDPYIQRYNKLVTLIWRANTDFSPIIDMNAIIRYINKYTTKSEIYMDFIEKMSANQNQNNRAKSILTKSIISSISERDYSAQEDSAHILMSWPLYGSSRSFKSLCIYEQQLINIEVKLEPAKVR